MAGSVIVVGGSVTVTGQDKHSPVNYRSLFCPDIRTPASSNT